MLYTRTREHAAHRFLVLSNLLFVLMPSFPRACDLDIEIRLTGSQIVDIPRNMSSNVGRLHISNTNISILNLTATGDYPAICLLEIVSSPVKTIIIPYPPQTVALTNFRLASGNFPTPPDLGIVLAEQLQYLTFKDIGLVNIPDNYFANFTSLIGLSLNRNPLSDLNAGNMVGLRNLRILYIDNTYIRPLPPLHLWLPSLRLLSVTHTYITALSASTLENLPNLERLDLSQNEVSAIPDQNHFVNLENMVFIKLEGNPLRCDSQLCWVKVITATICMYRLSEFYYI